MGNLKNRYIIILILLLSLFMNLAGIEWGIPSKARTDLVFSFELRNESFYNLMKQTREEIYEFSYGSPLGRIRNASLSSLTPIFKSMGIKEKENLHFSGQRKILANFIRPSLLRSNHPDEQMTIASLGRMRPKSLDFNPHLFQYGGVYIYGMGAWFGMLHVLGVVKLTPDLNFYFQNPQEMGKIFAVGRGINSFFSILILFLIFLISKEIYSLRTAIISVLFFVICPAMIFQAHIMKPYPLATFFAMVCLYYSLRIIKSTPTMKKYILSWIFAGLTIGTLYGYGVIIIAPLLAHFMVSRQLNRKLLYACLISLAVFFITNPYWLIKFKDVWWEIKSMGGLSISKNLSSLIDFFLYQFPLFLSYPLLIICLAGIIFTVLRREKIGIFLISVCVIPLFFFGWRFATDELSLHNSRFFLPFICVLLILGARFIDVLLSKKHIKLVAVAFVVFTVIQTTLNSLVCSQNFILDSSLNSTRIRAGEWITKNIPAGSNIGIGSLPEPAHVPPFDFSRYRITLLQNYLDKRLPDYFIAIDTVPLEIITNTNYQMIQSFKPLTSFYGFRFEMGSTHVNSPVFIYKKVR